MSDDTREIIKVLIRGLKFTVSLLEKLLKNDNKEALKEI